MTARGTLRICVPEDHASDGTIARWTAEADVRVGRPYTYSTIGVSVWLDWRRVGERRDVSPDPSWQTDAEGWVVSPLVNEGVPHG